MSASHCWRCNGRMKDGGVEYDVGGNTVRMHRSCAERESHRFIYPPPVHMREQDFEPRYDRGEPPAERELDFN